MIYVFGLSVPKTGQDRLRKVDCLLLGQLVGEPGLTAVVCDDGGIDLQEHAINTTSWSMMIS